MRNVDKSRYGPVLTDGTSANCGGDCEEFKVTSYVTLSPSACFVRAVLCIACSCYVLYVACWVCVRHMRCWLKHERLISKTGTRIQIFDVLIPNRSHEQQRHIQHPPGISSSFSSFPFALSRNLLPYITSSRLLNFRYRQAPRRSGTYP